MSQIVANQINCLQRLQDTTGQLEEILQFLKLEKLVDDNEMKSVKLSADHAKEIQQILARLQKAEKFQMLVYEWNILPVENILISIVTDRNSREFTFNR
jgi:hypothetical protein